jgi:hypothetical protein
MCVFNIKLLGESSSCQYANKFWNMITQPGNTTEWDIISCNIIPSIKVSICASREMLGSKLTTFYISLIFWPDFRFSWHWVWRWPSSGMLHHVVWLTFLLFQRCLLSPDYKEQRPRRQSSFRVYSCPGRLQPSCRLPELLATTAAPLVTWILYETLPNRELMLY